ncbi:hypothetical protein Ae201684P_004271 [Aphanomyces euteiches]|nr:hypothetical protein Ae201684P_004271 [Aphanomyces euteiches]
MRLLAVLVASFCLSLTSAVPNCDRAGCNNCYYDYEFRRCVCDHCSTPPPVPPVVTPPSSPPTPRPTLQICGRDECGYCVIDQGGTGICVCPCDP